MKQGKGIHGNRKGSKLTKATRQESNRAKNRAPKAELEAVKSIANRNHAQIEASRSKNEAKQRTEQGWGKSTEITEINPKNSCNL